MFQGSKGNAKSLQYVLVNSYTIHMNSSYANIFKILLWNAFTTSVYWIKIHPMQCLFTQTAYYTQKLWWVSFLLEKNTQYLY